MSIVRQPPLLPLFLTTIILLISAVFFGCGTMPNGRGWGQDSTLLPGWQRIRKAAVDAIRAPEIWVPAGTALILQVGDTDTRLSEWAVKNTPVYGSNENADDASDKLRNVARGVYLTSVIATPSGPDPVDWAFAKAKGFAVEAASVQITRNVTGFLKGSTNRTRPNEANNHSFPSHHASETAVYSILASRNIKAMALPGMLKSSLQEHSRSTLEPLGHVWKENGTTLGMCSREWLSATFSEHSSPTPSSALTTRVAQESPWNLQETASNSQYSGTTESTKQSTGEMREFLMP